MAKTNNSRDFIADAIGKPGALHRQLNIDPKEKIPLSTLKAAAAKPGKLGARAQFALTLRKMMGGKPKKKMAMSRAIIAGTGSFSRATETTPPPGMPKELNGKPCFYYWKHSWPADETVTDKNGKPFKYGKQKLGEMIAEFNRFRENGNKVDIPEHHKRIGENYGYVVDARQDEKGDLHLLHQFIGEDERRKALNKDSSLCVVPVMVDGKGNAYTDLIEHNAAVSDARCPGLDGWVPATDLGLAASRTDDKIEVTLLQFSRTDDGADMNIAALRQLMGAAATGKSDQEVVDWATGHINGLQTKVAAVTGERDTLQASRTADPTEREQLAYGKLVEREFADLDPTKVKIGKPTIDGIRDLFIKDGKATTMAMSRTGADGKGDELFTAVAKVLKANAEPPKTTTTTTTAPATTPAGQTMVMSREVPGQDDWDKQAEIGRKQAEQHAGKKKPEPATA